MSLFTILEPFDNLLSRHLQLNPDATNADEDAEGSEPALSARPQRVFRTRVVEEDMSPEEKRRRDAIDMKCLGLCIGMLERVNSVRRTRGIFRNDYGDLTCRS